MEDTTKLHKKIIDGVELYMQIIKHFSTDRTVVSILDEIKEDVEVVQTMQEHHKNKNTKSYKRTLETVTESMSIKCSRVRDMVCARAPSPKSES